MTLQRHVRLHNVTAASTAAAEPVRCPPTRLPAPPPPSASLAAGSRHERKVSPSHVTWSAYVRARVRETDGTRYAAHAPPRRGCRASRPVGLA